MKKIVFKTSSKSLPADIHTPVGIYLRLRDRFRDTILLESTDFHVAANSYSIIAINAVGGIELKSIGEIEHKYPAQKPERKAIGRHSEIPGLLGEFLLSFENIPSKETHVNIARSLFGYTSFDACLSMNGIRYEFPGNKELDLPLIRYRIYQYVIVINHFRDELYLCENEFPGLESERMVIETLIKSRDVPLFPFSVDAAESSTITDDRYKEMVSSAISSCKRGDSFQMVVSRRFQQKFRGDDFNVYRALRMINPGPYLFYFDYGDYKLMGSSPESQLVIKNNKAIVHPIAGTYKRTGDDEVDQAAAIALENDPKENAEHVMLVDLARNDLSRIGTGVHVAAFRKVEFYSHVIHLVSEVVADIEKTANPFEILYATFPAGTLSGAPKHKALQLISGLENAGRGFYGGTIGSIGLDGSCNHAILIRSFLSKDNTLTYQAGAGVVVNSDPATELEEVNHKLAALKKAIAAAETLNAQSS